MSAQSEKQHIRNVLGGLARQGKQPDRLTEIYGQVRAERIRDEIAKSPPLPPEVRSELAALLMDGGAIDAT